MSTTMVLMFTLVSQTFSLPPGLMSALCFVESGHRPQAIHKDDGGQDSVGVCQVHYTTAKEMGFTGTPSQLLDPKVNITYSAKYLASQIKRYHNIDKGIVAYNLGHYSPKYKKYLHKVRKAWSENR